ncbi:flagellar basal body rod protein FlgC [Vibrio marisflavi]|uniref:Flagellar basal-body rod protein FlgC n=1 Tax=Vibrio marisflavi CECT 7928 TaxID=634439 RepID=A0ABN8E6K8_9VIBR|nr:flagellar basal body rod protein FlgC [Vibrio marisflavi]CAH0540065.1 Flagellar basal-body rod protein FlgC [Vibrio marisflavi CECT 7928]
MSLDVIYNIMGSAMNAENIRLNTVASNLANANSVGTTQATTYHAKQAVFSTVYNNSFSPNDFAATVKVAGVINDSQKPLEKLYEPNNPKADKAGYVYSPNVNTAESMANMISASRSYSTDISVLNSVRSMQSKLLTLGD